MKWTQSIVVDRPLRQVQAAIADENDLMAWSAWPRATGFTCAVEGDGRSVGSEIVFTDRRGREQGRQRLASVSPTLVEYRLRNRGPGGREITPEVDYRLEDLGDGRTRVLLDFRTTPPVPAVARPVVSALLGRRVRRLHLEDLELLMGYIERQPVAP